MFSDDESDVEVEEGLDFKINASYAKKFEYNKKREEKQKLEEKYKDEDSEYDSEDDEIEDENGQLITPEIDAQILKTIAMLQKKDESLYNSDRSYFNDTDLENSKKQWLEKARNNSSKPVLLKDYQRKRLMDSSEHSDVTATAASYDPSFVQEQEALKYQFTSAVGQEDEEDLFTVRPANLDEVQLEQEKYSEFLLSQIDDGMSREKWENAKKEMSEKKDENFLMQFVLNRGWIDPNENKVPTYNEITLHDSTDEEELEKMEDFEAKYNFRFEEGGSEHVVTHAREIPGIIRRKDNSRILKRAAEKEHKQLQKLKKQEELKRLKNLKREELTEKLKKIQEMAGGDLIGLNEMDLDGDFDPSQYDKRMDTIFTDEYYSSKEVKSSGKLKKPKWDDDIDIGDLVPEAAVPKGANKKIKQNVVEEENDYQEYNEETVDPALVKSQIDKYLDEYYQLDYEDMIGDMPVRFKYRQVDPEDFSLKTEEVLMANDTDLNNVVSLKKLGPYRAGQVKEKDNQKWKLTKKKKLWEFRSKLKGKVFPQQDQQNEVEEHANKKLRREAKINSDRLASYSASKPNRK